MNRSRASAFDQRSLGVPLMKGKQPSAAPRPCVAVWQIWQI